MSGRREWKNTRKNIQIKRQNAGWRLDKIAKKRNLQLELLKEWKGRKTNLSTKAIKLFREFCILRCWIMNGNSPNRAKATFGDENPRFANCRYQWVQLADELPSIGRLKRCRFCGPKSRGNIWHPFWPQERDRISFMRWSMMVIPNKNVSIGQVLYRGTLLLVQLRGGVAVRLFTYAIKSFRYWLWKLVNSQCLHQNIVREPGRGAPIVSSLMIGLDLA